MAEYPVEAVDSELSRIHALVRSTRTLLRGSWIAIGTGLTIGLGLLLLLTAAMTDLLVPLPIAARLAAFLLVVAPTALAFLAGVVRPGFRRLSDNLVARRIERAVPRMDSRLVTSLDLARHRAQRRSAAFFAQLVGETSQRLGEFRPRSMVAYGNLRRAGLIAAAGVVAFAALRVAFHDRLPTAIARILMPLADIPPATGVRFVADPGDTGVLKGDDVTIAGVIEQGRAAELEIEFRGADGRRVRQPMVATAADRFEFRFDELAHAVDYRLLGGGTWTRQHHIDVIERPAITGLHTIVRFPEYMKLPDPVVGPAQNGDAVGPAGSTVEVVVEAVGDVANGELQLVVPVTKLLKRSARKERVWFESQLPAGASSEGAWQWDHQLKFRAAHTDSAAAGPHGHGFHSAKSGFAIQPDDHLYTYVFIVPGQVPDEIMLQWHDGQSWEHRAYWGADKIQAGAPDTASRYHAGDIPAPGEWVLLDVPARMLGLDGRKIHGIQFTLFGGQAKFHRAGAIEPAEIPLRSFEVQRRIAMRPEHTSPGLATDPSSEASGPQIWSGHIPLTHDGLYRIELKNRLGHANKHIGEHTLTAIPDQPPHVAVERPGADIVISEPQQVPLVIHADDDFGLADVSLAVQPGDSGGFVGAPVRTYDDPIRRDSIVAAIDAPAYLRKPGDVVRYRVLARDRKGQTAETREFLIRLAPDGNAADKQLAALDKQHEAIEEKLRQLIEQQAKVTEKAASASQTDRAMDPASQQAARETSKEPGTAKRGIPKFDPAPDRPASKPSDADLEKTLAQRRQQLAEAAQAQLANAELAKQFSNDLAQTAGKMAESKLLPDLVADQMRAAEQLFAKSTLEPMRQLAEALKRMAEPGAAERDPTDLAKRSEQIEENLQAIQARLDALAQARKNLKQNPVDALADLKRDLMAQNAQLSAQELAKLAELIDRLMGQMKLLEGKTNELARQTQDAAPMMLPQIEQEQTQIERDADRLMAQAEPLMDAESLPDLAQMPGPDSDTPKARPRRNESADEPSGEMQGRDPHRRNAELSDGAAEPLPSGVRQKLDARSTRSKPRGANGSDRASAPADSKSQDDPAGTTAADQRKGRLSARQQQTARELNTTRQQLQPRRQQLNELLEQLRQAIGVQDDEAMRELAQLMQSMDMRQALQLAQAMQAAAHSDPDTPNGQPAPPPPGSDTPSLAGMVEGFIANFQGNELDLAAETVLLRMQPRLREELLRGMNEQGPEAYRKFIEDYFNRLTRVKPQGK